MARERSRIWFDEDDEVDEDDWVYGWVAMLLGGWLAMKLAGCMALFPDSVVA